MLKPDKELPRVSGKQLTIILKRCSKCREEKSIDHFHKNKLRKDGYSCYCKTCNNKTRKFQYKKCRENGTYNRKAARRHAKTWRDKNKDKIRVDFTRWFLNKRETDPGFKMKTILRNRIGEVLKRIKSSKHKSTIELLGCDIEKFTSHMEEQFTAGMTWDNHGRYGWHVDHKKPCAAFDLTCEKQQKECFHYTNLQPLWAEDNLKKGAKT